jgi:hypothetical protein
MGRGNRSTRLAVDSTRSILQLYAARSTLFFLSLFSHARGPAINLFPLQGLHRQRPPLLPGVRKVARPIDTTFGAIPVSAALPAYNNI